MTTNPKRPRQSFKSTQWRELRLLRYFLEEESFRRNALQGIHWGKGKTVRKVFWEINCSNLVWYSLLAERFDWQVQDWYWVSGLVLDYFLHLVPSRETKARSGILRSHCLSALQELVGRNGLPLLFSSKLREQVLLLFKFLCCYLCMIECYSVAYDVNT